MIVPLEWLRSYCDPGLCSEAIAERLTMTGTKVEAVRALPGGAWERYVVGYVEDVWRHPNADRLHLCRVGLGGQSAQIVCGAPNVAPGQLVAVALPGAVLPDGRTLAEATVRGVVSEGMILSAPELGLEGDESGILVLTPELLRGPEGAPKEVVAGEPLGRLAPLGGEVLELEVTPNRPDCLAVYGVARELHAATGAPLAPAPWQGDPGSGGAVEGVSVAVECPDLCPRFMARLFREIKVGPSPLWLQARLVAAGQRPINNVVDITNYVMLLCGHPLHAFDFGRLAGGRLVVRRARSGERLKTLDGQERELREGMIVICDQDGPTSLAGVMGGARSEVGHRTVSVLLEAATWERAAIQRTAALLGLRSEAVARFEKGLGEESAAQALALASKLLRSLCAAELVPGTVDVRAEGERAAKVITFRPGRVNRILGVEVEPSRQRELLTRLGFGVEDRSEGTFTVTVPSWRAGDVYREADLVEEIARFDGLARLPTTLPRRAGAAARLTPAQLLRRRLADFLVGRGFFEVVGWTFTAPRALEVLRLGAEPFGREPVAVYNPLSGDQSLLRPTLLASLAQVAAYNHGRGRPALALFERGRLFYRREGRVVEREALGLLAKGPLFAPSWRTKTAPLWDYFALKALLEELFSLVALAPLAEAVALPFLHPGRSARLRAQEGEELGYLGELHPEVGGEELAGAVIGEIWLEPLLGRAPRSVRFQGLPAFPAVGRDLSFWVGGEVAAATLLERVREAGAPLLEEVRVIDLYQDPAAAGRKRSLTLALTFRSPERTLSDREVEPLLARIVARAGELGATLRGELERPGG